MRCLDLPWKLASFGRFQGEYSHPTYLLIRRDSVVLGGPGEKSRSPEIPCNIAPDLPKYLSGDQNQKPLKGNLIMKTFLVYDLDTGLPVAVGEAIKAEWARFEAAEDTKIRAENLIAEEITEEVSL